MAKNKIRPKQRLRRYVYEDDEKEVTEWALQAIREERIPKPFFSRAKASQGSHLVHTKLKTRKKDQTKKPRVR